MTPHPGVLTEKKRGLGLIAWSQHHHAFVVTGALVAIILAVPGADHHPYIGGLLVLPVFAIILTFGGLRRHRLIRNFVLPAAGLWAAARMADEFGAFAHLDFHVAPVAGLLLSCVVLWIVFDHFEHATQITGAIISWAFAGYLMIAVAFGQLYIILNDLFPRAFHPVIPDVDTSTLLYFSMTTLSSVGYGDVVPVDPFIRIVSALEGMLGVFYVAVVVARLVGASLLLRRPPEAD